METAAAQKKKIESINKPPLCIHKKQAGKKKTKLQEKTLRGVQTPQCAAS
jgi:hypothetical protein